MVVYKITVKLMYQELTQPSHSDTCFIFESSETCSNVALFGLQIKRVVQNF